MLARLCTLGLALVAIGAGASLGVWGLPLLKQGGPSAEHFALVRYEGWLRVVFAHVVCLAATAGIVR